MVNRATKITKSERGTLEILYNARMEIGFHDENLAKHNVTPDEAEEVLNDEDGWTERTRNGAYLVVGKTFGGVS